MTDHIARTVLILTVPNWCPYRDEWALWVTRLGFDPNNVSVPNEIVIDHDARTVEVDEYARDGAGKRYRGPDGMAAMRRRKVQLESQPLPHPPMREGAGDWLRLPPMGTTLGDIPGEVSP